MRTYVYVDAFNLYYGSLKGTPYRWLNLEALARRLLKADSDIQRIKYFTARVSARINPDQPVRQQAYLRALATLPCCEVHYGHFMTHEVTMPCVVAPGARQTYAVCYRTDEKGSDVNLATHLLTDAYGGKFEQALVITGDSDLLAPVAHLTDFLRRRVGVANPQRRECVVLRQKATFYKHIREGALKTSLFPYELTDAKGTFHCPQSWR